MHINYLTADTLKFTHSKLFTSYGFCEKSRGAKVSKEIFEITSLTFVIRREKNKKNVRHCCPAPNTPERSITKL